MAFSDVLSIFSSILSNVRYAANTFLNFQLVPDVGIRVWHLILIPFAIGLLLELFSSVLGFDL